MSPRPSRPWLQISFFLEKVVVIKYLAQATINSRPNAKKMAFISKFARHPLCLASKDGLSNGSMAWQRRWLLSHDMLCIFFVWLKENSLSSNPVSDGGFSYPQLTTQITVTRYVDKALSMADHYSAFPKTRLWLRSKFGSSTRP